MCSSLDLDPTASKTANMEEPLLRVLDLRTHFWTDEGIVKAVDGVSYQIQSGEVLGVVGESGSGKTVSALSILRLIQEPIGRIVSGQAWFEGQDLLALEDEALRQVRGKRIAMVFQEPMTSLNPVLTIGRQMTEMSELHLELGHSEARRRAIQQLEMVGIPEAASRIDDYPHQFSGGMRQRVMIAMALSCNPRLLVADEPTTALDVTTQAQILELMTRLARETETAVIIITHNMGVVARYADRVNVMYAGRIIESAAATELYANPRHPYTIALLRSVPRLDDMRRQLDPVEGLPPDLITMPEGCHFQPRCRFAADRCSLDYPPSTVVSESHTSACWEWEHLADPATGKLR